MDRPDREMAAWGEDASKEAPSWIAFALVLAIAAVVVGAMAWVA